MIVLGLDPSLTNYGWAIHDTCAEGKDRCLDRGRFRTKPKDFPDEVSRYIHLRESLRSLIAENTDQIEAMGIEHPVMNENYSEGMYALFILSLEAIKAEAKDVVLFAPPQVKRFAKDKSGLPSDWKMGKSDMSDAAKEDTGGGRWDHNEADAYHVACMAGRWWDFYKGNLSVDELTPYEKKTFTQQRTISRGKRAGQVEAKGFIHRENDRFFLWSVADKPKKVKPAPRRSRKKNAAKKNK